MSWEYVKGSAADFDGAPEWATVSFGEHDSVIFGFAEKWKVGYRYCYADDEGKVHFDTLRGWIKMGKIIAQRRKVDNLQSGISDASAQQAFDTVQRPAHYNQSDIECIDAIKASMTDEEFRGFLKGNVQKYVWRSEHKGGAEDYRKAQYYLERLVKELRK